jgi:hypothetical protein
MVRALTTAAVEICSTGTAKSHEKRIERIFYLSSLLLEFDKKERRNFFSYSRNDLDQSGKTAIGGHFVQWPLCQLQPNDLERLSGCQRVSGWGWNQRQIFEGL